MDFTPDLLAFQGAIMSADNKCPFKRISSRGGNENEIHDIVMILDKFFQDNHYYDKNGSSEKQKDHLRRFCFYLILNTDFAALEEITELPDVGHLVWTAPIISKCMLSDVVFTLRMEKYVGEIISYSNPLLSVEILKVLVNGVRYVSAQSSIEKLHYLAFASYRCISRLNFYSYDKALVSSLLSELFNSFLRSITHFVSPPNNGKLEELSVDEQHVHLGNAFHSLVDMTMKCLSVFESTIHFEPNDIGLFLATNDKKVLKTKDIQINIGENSEPAVLEYLQKCNIALLDKCVELVMKVSVDVFCCWSEHDKNGKTLQRAIGELCNRLLHSLERMKDLSQHTLLSMLPPICCKPIDVFDIIAEANDDAIISNACSSIEDREHWLNAIITKTNLYESEAFMSCLLKHLSFLKPEACEILFKRTVGYLKENEYCNESAKALASNCFVGVKPENKCDLVIDLFPNRVLHNLMEMPDFKSTINEIFNKLISNSDCSLYEVFDVFVQNPCSVYKKILSVGIENPKQASLMLELCVMLSPFSEYFCDGEKESALVRAIEELCAVPLETEVQEKSFISLISGINGEITVVHDRLLLLIIMPQIRKLVASRELRRLQLQLRLVGRAYNASELVRWRAPLLATLARVLDAVRWTFTTYNNEAPATLHETIHLVTSLFNTYNSQIPEKDTNWLKTNLNGLKPLNGYYFKDVWRAPGKNFLQVITSSEVEIDDYPTLLAKILNSCTLKEWAMVWNSLVEASDRVTALEILQQSLSLMASAEGQHRSDNSQNCIQYCYRNFTTIVKEQYLADSKNDVDVSFVLDKIVELANSISEEDIEEIGQILLPLLASLSAKKPPSDSVTHAEITNRLTHCKFAELVSEVFTNAAQ